MFGNLVNKPDNTFTYKTVQRACCADALIPLQLQDIFDFSDSNQFGFDIPEEDYAKVKEKVYNYGAYANYGKSKSKGYPYTGYQSAPSNVSKVQTRDYGTYPYNYDYYGDIGDYPYDGYDTDWDSSTRGTNAKIVTGNDIQDEWILGYEADEDKTKYKWISSILRGFYKPNDTLLYSDEEFKEIEAAASDFINAIELPDDHPYHVFSVGLQTFISNLVDSISDVHSGPRSTVEKVTDPSKALCVAIASSVFAVEDSLFVTSNHLSKELDDSGVKCLCLPERISAYLEKF